MDDDQEQDKSIQPFATSAAESETRPAEPTAPLDATAHVPADISVPERFGEAGSGMPAREWRETEPSRRET